MRDITVTYHHEETTWWAESDDLPGFTAVADSISELQSLTYEGVSFYLDDEPHRVIEKMASGAYLLAGLFSPETVVNWYTQSCSVATITASVGPRQVVEESARPGVPV